MRMTLLQRNVVYPERCGLGLVRRGPELYSDRLPDEFRQVKGIQRVEPGRTFIEVAVGRNGRR